MLSATNVLLKISAARLRYWPHLGSLLVGLGQYRDSAAACQNSLYISALPAGVYTLQFRLGNETVRKRLVRRAE